MEQTSRQILWSAILGLLVFGTALVTRVGLLDLPPIYDELYQMLPARSWAENGTLTVLDGVYDRAALFTQLIAASFDIAGNRDVATARLLPSVLPGAALVVLVFLWTRMAIGLLAGWVVLVFMLLWPNGIEVSQYVRFYALQGLAFITGALMIFGGLSETASLRRRVLLLAGSIPFFLLALKLQMLTLIGLGAVGLWVAVVLLPGWLRAYRWLWWPVLIGTGGVVTVLASGVLDATIAKFWTIYNWAPWPNVPDHSYYHRIFRDIYPTFWPLFPVAALIALWARPRASSFALMLFVLPFLVQSFGALKGVRYLYPAMPFFFVIWAIALQEILPRMWVYIRQAAQRGLSAFLPSSAARMAAAAVLAVSLLFLFAANAAFERSLDLVRGKPADTLLGKKRWAWHEARDMVDPWLAEGAVIVTSEEMLAIEYLGDFDIAYNRPRFSELLFTIGPDVLPFTIDRRTGRPLAGMFEDFERIVACEPVGIFLINIGWLRRSGIPLRAVQAAWRSGAEVEIAQGPQMALIGWRRSGGALAGTSCSDLPTEKGGRAAGRLSRR